MWSFLSSFGGGLVAGDETRVDLHVGVNARCFVGTQASTKVYRNPDRRPCGHQLNATLEEGALLVLAPDPVQAFSGSSYTQRQTFHLAAGAGLVLVDWFSSGRAACGERWVFNRFQSRNEVWRKRSVLGDSDPNPAGQPGESSPLTPAVSPLRGEGAAADVRHNLEARRRAPALRSAEHRSANERGVHAASPHGSTVATNAASSVRSTETGHRAPSPLNGERAGVRGEAAPNAPQSELIFLDSLVLTPGDGALTAPHRMGRFNCLATLLLIGAAVRDAASELLEHISKEPVTRRANLIASASPVAGGTVLRIAGDGAESVGREIRRHLAFLSEMLGDDPWARKW